MIKHLRYLRYVLRHKYFVFLGCLRLRVPLWQAIVHDWTKFLPIEWPAYVERMAAGRHSSWESVADTPAYKRAWRHHWSANPHHWQFWIIDDQPAPMPERYVREMVADWYGAGMAQGKPDIAGWYATGKAENRYRLHPATQQRVEDLLVELED